MCTPIRMNTHAHAHTRTQKSINTNTESHALLGVRKGSISGPLLFNVYQFLSIYINDKFYIIKNVNIANLLPFIFNKYITEVLNLLEEDSNKLYIYGMN